MNLGKKRKTAVFTFPVGGGRCSGSGGGDGSGSSPIPVGPQLFVERKEKISQGLT